MPPRVFNPKTCCQVEKGKLLAGTTFSGERVSTDERHRREGAGKCGTCSRPLVLAEPLAPAPDHAVLTCTTCGGRVTTRRGSPLFRRVKLAAGLIQ